MGPFVAYLTILIIGGYYNPVINYTIPTPKGKQWPFMCDLSLHYEVIGGCDGGRNGLVCYISTIITLVGCEAGQLLLLCYRGVTGVL